MRALRNLFVLLLLLAGCAPRLVTPLSPAERALHREIIERMEENTRRIRSFSGMARVVIRNPKVRFAGDQVVHLAFPDRLRLETHDPLGGLLMLFVAKEERGFLRLPADGESLSFNPRRENLNRYFGFDWTVSELGRLLAGIPPLAPLTPESIRSERNGNGIVLSLLDKGRVRQRVRMNEAGEILRWDRLNSRGEVEETLFFEEFREVDGVRLPFRILLQKEGETALQIRYRSIFLNRPLDPGLFEVPPAVPEGGNR